MKKIFVLLGILSINSLVYSQDLNVNLIDNTNKARVEMGPKNSFYDKIIIFKSRKKLDLMNLSRKYKEVTGEAYEEKDGVLEKSIMDAPILVPPNTFIRSVEEGETVKVFLKKGKGYYYPFLITNPENLGNEDDGKRGEILKKNSFSEQSCMSFGTGLLLNNLSQAIGPTIALAYSMDNRIGAAILNSFAEWNSKTRVNGRLTGWSGVVTSSDCPTGQPAQISALSASQQRTLYATNPSAACPAIVYSGHLMHNYLALADVGTTFSTRSIVFNTDYLWSLDSTITQENTYDFQSILMHELGHAVGLVHIDNHQCTDHPQDSPHCYESPEKPTMSNFGHPKETCQRTLSQEDIEVTNLLYQYY